jgi:hypothetical protein
MKLETIRDWDDLVKPGITVFTPDPKIFGRVLDGIAWRPGDMRSGRRAESIRGVDSRCGARNPLTSRDDLSSFIFG